MLKLTLALLIGIVIGFMVASAYFKSKEIDKEESELIAEAYENSINEFGKT